MGHGMGQSMDKSRLEAFSDGVIAIIITIMVLELRVPGAGTWAALSPLMPVFLTYVLSFVYLGIYWNNHHHLLHTSARVTGAMLWANLHLLFWLSLFPAATAWMDTTHFAPVPVGLYGVVLLMAAVAYWMLQQLIMRSQGRNSLLRRAIGRDWKGKVSPLLYLLAIGLAVRWPRAALGIYALVACIWLVPDRRIERALSSEAE
jgi:uncharacterized membrane protein